MKRKLFILLLLTGVLGCGREVKEVSLAGGVMENIMEEARDETGTGDGMDAPLSSDGDEPGIPEEEPASSDGNETGDAYDEEGASEEGSSEKEPEAAAETDRDVESEGEEPGADNTAGEETASGPSRDSFDITLYETVSGTAYSGDGSDADRYFKAFTIAPNDWIYNRIYGRSYVDNPNVALKDLRYLKVLYYDFSHTVRIGELIVAAGYSDKVLGIFRDLYGSGYEINSMRLVDDFWAGNGEDSDTASIDANNTSAFCYRPVANGKKLSKHAAGRAIDINPQQNPYVRVLGDGSLKWDHVNANDYIDRSSGAPHMILKGDVCYSIFAKYGFKWGGEWKNPIDYQHFEIG